MKKLNLLNTKLNFRKIIATSLVLLSFSTLSLASKGQVQASISPKNLAINIGCKRENFQEEANAPYLKLAEDDTIFPIKILSEALGYKLNWKDFDLEVNLTYAKNPENKSEANKANNTKEQKIEVPADVNSVGDSKVYMKKLNDYRVGKSLGLVKEDEKLNKLALLRAQEELDQFINTGKGDHNSPGAYNKSLGENLTLSYYSLGIEKGDVNENSLTRWINSPGHNANLLNKDCKKGGYACARKVVDDKVYETSIYLFGY